ncbi:hypothetical protein [Mesorhizobium sp. M7A.F.Ca.US.010.02.1.1]|uniref:hypothetical protein n=1 Tax=Mesorhizobium sp. M7A.F.Ca.US.010.02.1.1 TaxID=2496743 RepID=UPI000FD2088E|nr:hypothetical protein [Mesorhizobium sp. M7A.F.Ca.US.010.02.1.1]RUW89172.1 hypothetical protein EOA19_26115 [Mesorhizobium sp. M7A.F.Ca.US.010.02.1.1]
MTIRKRRNLGKASENHAVLRRKAARKSNGDSSGRPKNEAARRKAQEFERFAADQGDMIEGMAEATVQLDYEAVAAIVAKGQELARDERAWLEFIALPFWTDEVKKGRPKPKHRPEAVRFMLRRYRGSSESKQASERWRAVKVLLDEGTPPSRMVKTLEQRGGYRGINRSKREGQSSVKTEAKSVSAKPSGVGSSMTSGLPDKTAVSCLLKAVFPDNVRSLTSLAVPCKVKLIGTIEELGAMTEIRVQRLVKLKPRDS